MARPLEDMARNLRPGPVRRQARPDTAANDNISSGPLPSSVLPPDARAIIETVPVATNQSGRARSTQWRLCFAPRSRPFIDPLTGWTGGYDPLVYVVLRFRGPTGRLGLQPCVSSSAIVTPTSSHHRSIASRVACPS